MTVCLFSFKKLIQFSCFAMSMMMLNVEANEGPSAPVPKLTYAFSVNIDVAKPLEQGLIDGGQRRFIEITGGTVYGPMLQGEVMHGGGDWQTVFAGGYTDILKYWRAIS